MDTIFCVLMCHSQCMIDSLIHHAARASKLNEILSLYSTHWHMFVHHSPGKTPSNRNRYSSQMYCCTSDHNYQFHQHIHQHLYTHVCHLLADSQIDKSKSNCQLHLCIFGHICPYHQCIHQYLDMIRVV